MSEEYTIEEVLECLNERKIRCTYGALADLLGVHQLSVGRLLGERCRKKSWIVNKATRRPTGYAKREMDPDLLQLLRNERIIDSEEDLRQLICDCRK